MLILRTRKILCLTSLLSLSSALSGSDGHWPSLISLLAGSPPAQIACASALACGGLLYKLQAKTPRALIINNRFCTIQGAELHISLSGIPKLTTKKLSNPWTDLIGTCLTHAAVIEGTDLEVFRFGITESVHSYITEITILENPAVRPWPEKWFSSDCIAQPTQHDGLRRTLLQAITAEGALS